MDHSTSAKDKVTSKLPHHHDHCDSLILVSGGTGFVATWVIHAFLSRGYRVRTTVRSSAKAAEVANTHKGNGEKLSFAIVQDITESGAFDEAVRDVDGVIHTASPFVLQVEDNRRDLLDPAMKGTQSILESVAKHAPKVKRVVITSSFAAILDLKQGPRPGYTYSEKDWNPVTMSEAETGDGGVAYCASKTFAERAAHDFVKQHKPGFTVAAINPPMVYGPLAQKVDIEHINTSAADIWRFMDGSLADQAPPPAGFPAFVDVRDVAKAHLAAYERVPPAAGEFPESERYFVTGGKFSNAQVCEILRHAFPDRKIPDPAKAEAIESFKVDTSKAKNELGIEFIPLEKCIRDTGKSLVEVEEAGKKGSKYDGHEWLRQL